MRADANVYIIIRQSNNSIVWLDASLKHMLESVGDTGDLKPRNEILPFLRVGIPQEFTANGENFTLTTMRLGTGTKFEDLESEELDEEAAEDVA